MKRILVQSVFIVALLFTTQYAVAQQLAAVTKTSTLNVQLPPGFTATVVTEGLAGARHMAINKNGGVYVKLSKLKDGKGIVYLKESGGKFIEQQAFGDYPGTGIYIRNNYLYASSNNEVFRYQLDNNGEVLHPDQPEKLVTGLVDRARDNAKSIAVDNAGNLYVNVGSYNGSCLVDPPSKKAPNPCPLLDSVGGIWQFKANKLNQQYKDGERYATGFKHAVGLDWNNKTNSLFITEHGRDQLHDFFPQYYTTEQAGLLPGETMYEVKKGADGGWPYVYYDPFQNKKILSPEYEGDGKKTWTGKALAPVVAFPAHLAPNGLLFYSSNNFPARYRDGAFVAFHGKSPELQKGYLVAFVPFNNNKPAGKWEIFAENFLAGTDQHKPCGLAQGPDGSLYVSDDAKGSIYRIRYNGM